MPTMMRWARLSSDVVPVPSHHARIIADDPVGVVFDGGYIVAQGEGFALVQDSGGEVVDSVVYGKRGRAGHPTPDLGQPGADGGSRRAGEAIEGDDEDFAGVDNLADDASACARLVSGVVDRFASHMLSLGARNKSGRVA